MNICTFDTETTSLNKPFCYNVGYKIADENTSETLVKRDFIVEQIWHNLPLFNTAYYANKREIYVSSMRARKTIMDKWGYIMQQMSRDFKYYEVTRAYAYNSEFDEMVFNYNNDWYKTQNPFDNVKIFDILGYVHEYISNTKEYQNFCEENKFFTESGNYSTTAENVYKYISNNLDFNEEHTALADSEIEFEILMNCGKYCDFDFTKELKKKRTVERETEKNLIIVQNKIETKFTYIKKFARGEKIFLK